MTTAACIALAWTALSLLLGIAVGLVISMGERGVTEFASLLAGAFFGAVVALEIIWWFA